MYFGDFWVVYTQSKVVRKKYGPISLTIEESASVVTIQLFQFMLLDQRIKASSLQDKTEGEHGTLINNYEQN